MGEMGAEIFFIAFAIGFFVYGIYRIRKYSKAINSYSFISGKVVDFVRINHKSLIAHYEIISYIVDGQEYNVKNHKTVHGTISKLRVENIGKERKVYYNPNNPNDAVVEGDKDGYVWIFSALFILFIFFIYFILFGGLK